MVATRCAPDTTLELYQVDAFTDRVFGGNPAAVCPLDAWLPDATLQAIAAENNLSETAFFVPAGDGFALRWFTPAVEVDLCGHATLATAWVIVHCQDDAPALLRFSTRSGELTVARDGDALVMDFPARPPAPCNPPPTLLAALGLAGVPVQVLEADDYIVVVDDAALVASLAPDIRALAGLPNRGVAVTAPGGDVDFVSRWFGPNVGVDEDPVTGSAHTALAPYWSARLGKSRLNARQGGRRQGSLECEFAGQRVRLRGQAVVYLQGRIRV
ncbi:PhzF family phenazine biosynthesis protein [Marilutibacter aestuarii]|uniref:PhzF family phenazine biosynthesis protein n=1 Tax=Marilutibacter aestuarii TaxID=1706195 RepID=A0A507ZWV5_9GAMM|nr:PhzF family phenazine biosynthesis protein [Lysobacter aestuarii]TQD42196.1 PhzF family phenazine biosynthesis protein [Lysobacter aestuarii]